MENGGGRRIRTLDPRLRRPLLYPTELYPRGRIDLTSRRWGGRRVSNPPPPEPQSGALPDELRPPSLALNNESTNLPHGVKVGRGREIRTPDILLPKQARYQTALYPDDSHRSARRPLISGARMILTCRLSVNANYMIGGHFFYPVQLTPWLQNLDFARPANSAASFNQFGPGPVYLSGDRINNFAVDQCHWHRRPG